MTEQNLDRADVGAGFEEVGGKAVAQGVDGDRLAELGRHPSVAAGPLQHAPIERAALVLARKQPMRGPDFPPVGAQDNEQLRREHDVAISAALALFNPDQHAAAVDVGDFQMHDLGYSEPGGIGGHQRGAVFQARHRRQKPRNLVDAQDHRQLPTLACIGNALDHRSAAERDAVEEAHGADGDVEAGPGNAGRGEVNLVGPDFCQPEPVRRPIEMPGEFGDSVHIATLRHRRQVADLHVLDHATAQQAQVSHGQPPVSGWGFSNPNPVRRCALLSKCVLLLSLYCDSGLVQSSLSRWS